MGMEYKPFKLDIDELISEFSELESSSFAEFKKVWLLKKFSFIFEAGPPISQDCFMQTLYAHSISYIVSERSLSKRLSGLYCLYCLHETQPFTPPFRIYLSVEELRRIKNLVIDAKRAGVGVVSALVKCMLAKNMFLFGYLGVSESSARERINELTDIQNARVRAAYKKLFENASLERLISFDLGREIDLDLLKKTTSEYALSKELAIEEASQVVDVQNVKHLLENKRLVGDVVEKIAGDLNFQNELFYQQTGFDRAEQSSSNAMNDTLSCENLLTVGNFDEDEEDDDFSKELEAALFDQPSE